MENFLEESKDRLETMVEDTHKDFLEDEIMQTKQLILKAAARRGIDKTGEEEFLDVNPKWKHNK